MEHATAPGNRPATFGGNASDQASRNCPPYAPTNIHRRQGERLRTIDRHPATRLLPNL